MKNIKIFLLATIVLLAGCEDFLNINESPNDPTEPDIDQLLPGIMYDIADDFSIGYAKLGYACAVYSHQMVTRQPEYDDYNINGYSYAVDTYWADLYAGPAEDLKLLIKMGEESDNLIYAGVAKILKAYLFSMMVDLWADIPYTEANTEGITKPVFDDGEQIYAALFTLIDEGIANIQNADAENILVPGEDDLIYGGDTDQWIRLANTLKLKMYNQVRLVSMYNQGAVDQLVAGDLIGPGDDFMLPFGTSVSPENRHPAFASEYVGTQISNYISPWFFEILSGYHEDIFFGIVDPRIPYYWCNQLAGGDPENPPEYKDGDFNTIMFGSVGPNRDHAGRASFTMMGMYVCGGTYDDGAQVGPLGSTDGTGAAPQRFITYADKLYIEAELMQVGRVAGDARAKLSDAIYASFEQVDMVVGMVTRIGSTQEVPSLSGSGADTAYVTAVLAEYDAGDAAKKLEIILTQKWISQWGNSMDQYTDYRRTGYPVRFDANSNGGIQYQGPDGTAPIPTQETRAFPLSFAYDKDEVILNPNCTQKIVSQSPVFWDE